MAGAGGDQINEVNIVDIGGVLTKRLPSRIRLYGFYDGDSSDNLLWTTRFYQSGFLATTGWATSSMMMQDDSYIEVNDDLHYEVVTDVGVVLTDCMITVYF